MTRFGGRISLQSAPRPLENRRFYGIISSRRQNQRPRPRPPARTMPTMPPTRVDPVARAISASGNGITRGCTLCRRTLTEICIQNLPSTFLRQRGHEGTTDAFAQPAMQSECKAWPHGSRHPSMPRISCMHTGHGSAGSSGGSTPVGLVIRSSPARIIRRT